MRKSLADIEGTGKLEHRTLDLLDVLLLNSLADRQGAKRNTSNKQSTFILVLCCGLEAGWGYFININSFVILIISIANNYKR